MGVRARLIYLAIKSPARACSCCNNLQFGYTHANHSTWNSNNLPLNLWLSSLACGAALYLWESKDDRNLKKQSAKIFDVDLCGSGNGIYGDGGGGQK